MTAVPPAGLAPLAARRLVVTGGAGFLGSFIVEQLQAAGAAEVFVPRSARYDLRERSAVDRMLAEARPEIVVHAAAVVAGIEANIATPATLFYDNAIMGLHVIEACRVAGVERVVTVGSVCSYPGDAPVPFREDSLWDGYPEASNAPYGLAKKMLLVQQQAYARQYGTRSAYLLLANLYGPRDDFDPRTSHVIPSLVRRFVLAAERGERSVDVWGSGTASREFLYVEDAARAVVLAAGALDEPEPVNVGSGHETTIRELAETIARLTGFRGEIVWDRSRPEGQQRRQLDVGRARAQLGFEASTALEDGLRRTIAWYRTAPVRRGVSS